MAVFLSQGSIFMVWGLEDFGCIAIAFPVARSWLLDAS
jgi:hypothetical protein